MAHPWAWSCPFGNDVDTSTPRARSRLRLTCERWCGQPHRPSHYGYAREHHGRCARAGAAPSRAPTRRARGGVVVAGRGLACWCWSRSAVTLAVWWAASRETRTTTYRVLGDLAGHPARPRRRRRGDRRRRDRGRGAPHRPLRVRRARPRSDRRVEDGTLTHRLALPGPGARLLPRLLPADRARQRPARDPDLERLGAPRRACARRCRSAPARARSPPPASAASRCARARTRGDVSARQRVLAPTGSSCARAAATCARSSPPAATRSTPRATRATSRIRGLTDADDAPFQIQALSTSGDVTVEAAS